uniref:Tubulin tyrosine ligase like 10 n=1 Tax=Varanus komodoensis TaxID=61221 RepID=A0A8D2IJG6_VARKO
GRRNSWSLPSNGGTVQREEPGSPDARNTELQALPSNNGGTGEPCRPFGGSFIPHRSADSLALVCQASAGILPSPDEERANSFSSFCRLNVYCKSKGWQRIYDNRREDFILKWCETKFRDTYYNFREGEQLLYQIPNNKVLTTKIGLLMNLREYERWGGLVPFGTDQRKDLLQPWLVKLWNSLLQDGATLMMEEFFPETFRLDTKDERESFFETYTEPQIWICKPTSSNQGRGIFLLKNQAEVNELEAKLHSLEEDPQYKKLPYKIPPARIVQRYIDKPLLLEGKKFDVRSYLLIACTVPFVLFFGHGYVRLTCLNYDPRSEDLTSHLTNQYVQKKSPIYALVKEETVWQMDRFNQYVNEKFRQAKGLPKDWVFNGFTKRMKEIMLQCFLAVKSKLDCKLGYFDLIGCDFLIDEDFKVWLLEMNANPALHTNCGALKNIVPTVVNETLGKQVQMVLGTRGRLGWWGWDERRTSRQCHVACSCQLPLAAPWQSTEKATDRHTDPPRSSAAQRAAFPVLLLSR